jgi:excisionase family DNA binding protein
MPDLRPGASCARVGALLTEVGHAIDAADNAPAAHLSAWLCQVAAVQALLAARWVRDLQLTHETARDQDHLLTVDEAAARLACSADWLYRHHHRLTFAIRNGRQLRFSADGLDRYIRERAGRESPSLPPRAER